MGYLTDGHRNGSSAGPGGARSSWYLAPGRPASEWFRHVMRLSGCEIDTWLRGVRNVHGRAAERPATRGGTPSQRADRAPIAAARY